jgi:hypothetical protein
MVAIGRAASVGGNASDLAALEFTKENTSHKHRFYSGIATDNPLACRKTGMLKSCRPQRATNLQHRA